MSNTVYLLKGSLCPAGSQHRAYLRRVLLCQHHWLSLVTDIYPLRLTVDAADSIHKSSAYEDLLAILSDRTCNMLAKGNAADAAVGCRQHRR